MYDTFVYRLKTTDFLTYHLSTPHHQQGRGKLEVGVKGCTV
jgi:hypothetical protein